MIQLEIFSPDRQSSTYDVEKFPVTIGRSRANDIVLTHRTVSRRHAVISKKGDSVIIKDLGSQNGTFLRKQKIEEATLKSEDVIYIGAYTLKFVVREDIIDLEKELEKRTPKEEELQLNAIDMVKIPDRFHGILHLDEDTDEKPLHEALLSNSKENTSLLAFPDEFLIPKEELPVLFALFKRCLEDDTLKDTLGNISKYLFSYTDADRIAIFLHNHNGHMRLATLEVRPGTDLENFEFAPQYSYLKEACENGQAILVNGINEESSIGIPRETVEKMRSYSAIFVALKADERMVGGAQIETYSGKTRLNKEQLQFVSRVVRELAQFILWKMTEEEKRKQQIELHELRRIHSQAIVEHYFAQESEEQKAFWGPKEQPGTALTCRIVNLVDLQNQISPIEIKNILEVYSTIFRKTVLHYKGTLAEFSNRDMTAIFGLPVKQLDNAVRAVLTALRVDREFRNHRTIKKIDKKIILGFGIQSGLLFGSHVRLNGHYVFWALGNPIDVSYGLTKLIEKKDEILVGPECFFDVRFYFDTEEVGVRELLELEEKLMVYRINDLKEAISEESILYLASENADSEITSEEFLRLPDV